MKKYTFVELEEGDFFANDESGHLLLKKGAYRNYSTFSVYRSVKHDATENGLIQVEDIPFMAIERNGYQWKRFSLERKDPVTAF